MSRAGKNPPPRPGGGAQRPPRAASASETFGRFLGTLARLESGTATKPKERR